MLPILACYLQLNTSSFTTHEDWFTCTPPPLWFFSFPFLPLSLSLSLLIPFKLPSFYHPCSYNFRLSLFFLFFSLFLHTPTYTIQWRGGGGLGQVGPKGILIMNDEKLRKESKEMQRRREEGRGGDRHTQRKWKERGTNRGECVCVCVRICMRVCAPAFCSFACLRLYSCAYVIEYVCIRLCSCAYVL